MEDFAIDPTKLDGAEILVASYTYECYEGDAYVLFRATESSLKSTDRIALSMALRINGTRRNHQGGNCSQG